MSPADSGAKTALLDHPAEHALVEVVAAQRRSPLVASTSNTPWKLEDGNIEGAAAEVVHA